MTASAKSPGVVDLTKVIENYTKAQEVSADLKVKETELQKFIADAQKKINDAKTPLEKKNIEEKLSEEFNIKRNVFAKEQAEKWQQIEEEIIVKINEVSKEKNLELILNKQAVIIGGEEITEEVIKRLNESVKKPITQPTPPKSSKKEK